MSRMLVPTMREEQLPAWVRTEAAGRSLGLLLRAGMIVPSSAGIYGLLPIGHRVIGRIERILEEELQSIGKSHIHLYLSLRADAQRVTLPILHPRSLWEQSGRLEAMRESVYLTEDGTALLAPTHEEEVTRVAAQFIASGRRDLPLRLYQIGPKFRRERRPRGGLLRLREFIMKDMYSFDRDLGSAQESYEAACRAYGRIFKRLELPILQVEASCGDMGGSRSHEFHLITEAGEDTLWACKGCGRAFSDELNESHRKCCPNEGLQKHRGLELGHAFLLGTRYSQVFGATMKDVGGLPVQMGCYGIGVSRLLGALVEAHGQRDALCWPPTVAPYPMVLMGAEGIDDGLIALSARLAKGLKEDLLLDDRDDLSLSWRLKDARLLGITIIVIRGRRFASEGLLEVHRGSSVEHLTSESLLSMHALEAETHGL